LISRRTAVLFLHLKRIILNNAGAIAINNSPPLLHSFHHCGYSAAGNDNLQAPVTVKFLRSFFLIPLILMAGSSMAQDTIYWSPHQQLKWEDFKGIPDTTLGYEALTHSGISCRYQVTDTSFTYHVAAFFLCHKSWKMPWADAYALEHEQIHFNITELHAGKLRKELSRLKVTGDSLSQAFHNLVERILDENEAMQNRYDAETDFGRIPAMQLKWKKELNRLLFQCKDPAFTIAGSVSVFPGTGLIFSCEDQVAQIAVDEQSPGIGAILVALERRSQSFMCEMDFRFTSFFGDLKDDPGALPLMLVLHKAQLGIRYQPYYSFSGDQGVYLLA
jgi:hypothetical protein